MHLVVDVVSAHSDGIHDILPTLVLSGGTLRFVRVVLCAEVMAEFMGCHQVRFLWKR